MLISLTRFGFRFSRRLTLTNPRQASVPPEGPPYSTVTPHSDAKSLFRGSALYAVANIGDKLISFFVLIPIYARFLTPAAYGLIALSDSIGQLIVRVFGLSLDDSLRRLYFQYIDQPQKLRQYVSTVLWSVLATVVLMLVLSFTIVPVAIHRFAPDFDVPFYPYISFSIGGAIGMYILLYRQLLYQVQSAAQKYLALSATSFAVTVAFALTLVVVMRRGAYGMLLAKLLAGSCIALLSIALMRRWFAGGWKWEYLKETLHLSLPLIPHYLTNYGLDVADRFILARYRPLAEVGLYSLAYTFGKSMYLVGLSVHQAWSPTFFSIARQGTESKERLGRMTSLIAIFLIWIAIAGTLAVQVFIGRFLDARYHPAARVVPWIVGSYLFQALYALCMLSAMQAKRSIFLFASSAGAFAVNVALNIILAPKYGMYGSAYANLLAFVVIAVLMYFFGQRLFHIPYQMGRILAALAVYCGVLAITQWNTQFSRIVVNGVAFAIGTVLLYLVSGRNLDAIWTILQRKDRSQREEISSS
jgi:O-antigen/teichoic acid export membrane protein